VHDVADNKIDLDKYRSIGHLRPGYKSSKKVIPHLDDQGRKDGGSQTEHFDGRVDAHIKAKAVPARSKTQGT